MEKDISKTIKNKHKKLVFKSKLLIDIVADNDHNGKIIWLEEDDVDAILNDNNVVKLVYQESNSYCFKAINWSYSKGDTLENACVILIDKFNSLKNDNFSCKNITKSTINKLYVAILDSRSLITRLAGRHQG